jgi:parallel beta-helix repeat protein
VGEAIRAASSGDRIFVRPGRYEESLLIDKPLEIIGDGPLARIEIVGAFDHVLNFRAETGLVVNLTLPQPSEPPHQGVFIVRGELHLEGCDISSRTGSGVYILGGSKPILRRNVIHFAKEVGVVFQKGGGGTLEDNEIAASQLASVELQAGSDPVLRRNVIRASQEHGVYIHDDGRGTFEENQITGSKKSGVAIAGSPTLRGNRITGNRWYGIQAWDGGVPSRGQRPDRQRPRPVGTRLEDQASNDPGA